MLDFDACPELSFDTALEAAACGATVVWSAAAAAPWATAAVAVSAVLTALIGRSVAIGLAVLLLAIILADIVLSAADPMPRQARLAGAAASLALIWIGCLRYRRRLARQEGRIAALEAERDGVQAKLDREIVWRRAADPEENAIPTSASGRRQPDS